MCWIKREGLREPMRLKEPGFETCCFCGTLHHSGIYTRADPQTTLCKGQCEEEDE
jgi:hypothetical protein